MAERGENKVLAETQDAVAGRLQQYCKPCYKGKKSTPASVYCKSCKEFQCWECLSHHKRYDFMSDHDIIAKDQADPEDCDLNINGCDTCSVHGSSVEIYCEDHDVLICTKCAFYDHKKCENAKHIDEFPLDKKIEEFRKILTVCYDKAEKYIDNVNEIGVKERGEVRAKAERIKSEFCEKIHDSLAEYLIEIDSATERFRSTLQHKMPQVLSIHKELETWIKSLNISSKQGFTDRCFVLSKSLRIKVMKHEEFLTQDCLGNTSVLNTEHMFNEKNDATVQVNSSDILHQDGDANASTGSKALIALKPMALGPVKNYKQNEIPFIKGIDFLNDGRLVALDNANMKCVVLNETLQVLGKPFKFFTNPMDICVYKENKAAVTSANLFYFLNVETSNYIRLERKVSTSASYYSISRFNCSMFLCSTYSCANVSVRVVDFEAKETDFKDIVFPCSNDRLNSNFSTYAEQLGIIVLTDFLLNKVYMINTHSGEINTVEHKLIQGPRQVCMGPDDTVFVVCEANKYILHISIKGKISQAFSCPIQVSAIRTSKDGTKLVMAFSNETKGMFQFHVYELSNTK